MLDIASPHFLLRLLYSTARQCGRRVFQYHQAHALALKLLCSRGNLLPHSPSSTVGIAGLYQNPPAHPAKHKKLSRRVGDYRGYNFERTFGKWEGELERPPQGELETREALDEAPA